MARRRQAGIRRGQLTALDTRIAAIDSYEIGSTMPDAQHRRRDREPLGGGAGERANDALTNLSAYALTLDLEYHRLDDRLMELAKTEPAAAELGSVLRERAELAAEREAFRGAVMALREQLSPIPACDR
jgi:hypothetical protein